MLLQKRLVYTLQALWCLFIFCQRQTDLRFILTPRRGILHCGVMRETAENISLFSERQRGGGEGDSREIRVVSDRTFDSDESKQEGRQLN